MFQETCGAARCLPVLLGRNDRQHPLRLLEIIFIKLNVMLGPSMRLVPPRGPVVGASTGAPGGTGRFVNLILARTTRALPSAGRARVSGRHAVASASTRSPSAATAPSFSGTRPKITSPTYDRTVPLHDTCIARSLCARRHCVGGVLEGPALVALSEVISRNWMIELPG